MLQDDPNLMRQICVRKDKKDVRALGYNQILARRRMTVNYAQKGLLIFLSFTDLLSHSDGWSQQCHGRHMAKS